MNARPRPRPKPVSRLGQNGGLKKAPLQSPLDGALPPPSERSLAGRPVGEDDAAPSRPPETADASSPAQASHPLPPPTGGRERRPAGGRPTQFAEGTKRPWQIMLLPSTVTEARQVAEFLRRSGHPEVTFPVFVEAALRVLIEQVRTEAGDPEGWESAHPTPRAFEHLLPLPEKNTS